MVKVNRFAALLCAVILFFTLCASAQAVDIGDWNTDSTLYEILNADGESNCDAERIFLRVKYDRSSNRIKMLFMLEFSEFHSEENAGVTLSINDGEKITLRLNGENEYNKDKYFAETDVRTDPRTKTLLFEVTLGIKQGIPENVRLDFNIYDTQGVASNTYCADITEAEASTVTQTDSEKTKIKSTQTRTKKTNRPAKTDSETTVTSLSEEPETLTQQHTQNDVVRVSEKKFLTFVLAGVVAVMIVMPAVTRHIRNPKNPRDGG